MIKSQDLSPVQNVPKPLKVVDPRYLLKVVDPDVTASQTFELF